MHIQLTYRKEKKTLCFNQFWHLRMQPHMHLNGTQKVTLTR